MFDGNGNWTSDFSAQSDRDNGIKILASRFDNIFIADIKESFENCLTKDGQIAPIGNFNMGGQRITNLNNGVSDNDAVNMSQLNTKVSLTGNETISGEKTFVDTVIYKNAGATIANPPNNVSWRYTDYTDNNNVRIGVIGSQINPNGWHGTYLQAGNEGNINIITNGIDVITYAPACDADNSIVTTVNKSKAANGYVKFGNGLIVQWGTLSSGKTITYSTAFTNADSYVLVFNNNSTTDGYGRGDKIESKSSTSATVNVLCENPIRWLAIGY